MSAATSSGAAMPERGAYGLRITGLEDASTWLAHAGADLPALDVSWTVTGVVEPPRQDLGPDSMATTLREGSGLQVARTATGWRAEYRMARAVEPADLVHPYLAPAAAFVARRLGRVALHGGAVQVGDGALVVLASREGGKSTTLAWLAIHRGVDVLSDDLVIVEDGRVWAGPRCVDLRPESVALVQPPETSVVRSRSRQRLVLGPVPEAQPLRGVVVLGWADAVSRARVGPADRLAILASHCMWPDITEGAEQLLDLAQQPMWSIRRPRDPNGLAQAADAMVLR